MSQNYLVFGGIGATLSKRLQAAGHRVFASGRDPERLAMLSAELGTEALVADATVSAEVTEAMQTAVNVAGTLHGVVNCVGSLLLKPAHLTTDDEWANVIHTNLTSSFLIVREAAKALMSTGGSVILTSSAAARHGLQNHEAISAAKAGVIGLVLSAAASYAARNIRFNGVAPGLVDTPLTARITGNEAAAKASAGMHALARFGSPDDIASMMQFLLDPANSWITGQVFGVDGGLASVRAKG